MAAIMIQGCGSDVGKSVLVAGLCRLFTQRGLIVRPFKSQNMSNNAAVTADGGEIGRAQALQAIACKVAPTVHMNPVLLKPESDVGAQLIVRGKRAGVLHARAHIEDKRALLSIAVESFRELEREADFVIVEGAGSPAETNLRMHDIANMGFASAVDLPVLLVGDIDRGHVIAALVGAHTVLSPEDRSRIHGFIINKFRGDVTLFADGTNTIVTHTGWRALGIVPWLAAANRLPSEDAVRLEQPEPEEVTQRPIKVAVPCLARIANFDDFDPLRLEPSVALIFVPPGQPLPADATVIILPGTKSTIADMAFLRAQGWDIDLLAHVRRGGRVLGICGGYQMLGRLIHDSQGIEGRAGSIEGLGLLDIETSMTADKTLRAVSGSLYQRGAAFSGYEMHIGVTTGPGTTRPLLRFDDGRSDGARSSDERICGCYVHGLFGETSARQEWLRSWGTQSIGKNYMHYVDAALDEIAAVLEQCLDVRAIEHIARHQRGP
jgi:adenosylcobyric acid synthase